MSWGKKERRERYLEHRSYITHVRGGDNQWSWRFASACPIADLYSGQVIIPGNCEVLRLAGTGANKIDITDFPDSMACLPTLTRAKISISMRHAY